MSSTARPSLSSANRRINPAGSGWRIRIHSLTLTLGVAAALAGCANQPAKTGATASGSGHTATGASSSTQRLAAAAEAEAARPSTSFNLQLATPPGVDADQLAVRKGDAMAKAAMNVEQVLAKVQPPAYLKAAVANTDKKPADKNAAAPEPPEAAVKAYALGRAAYREGNRWDAITQLEQARRIDPKSPEILRLLGDIYFSYGNDVKGAERLTEAVRLDPDDPESLFLLGRFAFKKGEWDEAIYTLARCGDLADDGVDPAMADLRPYYLGQALLQQGYDSAAIDLLNAYLVMPQRYTRISPLVRELALLDRQRGRVHMQIGDAECRLGRFDRALAHYDEAAQSADDVIDSSELTPRRIYTMLAMNRPNSAEQLLITRLRESKDTSKTLPLMPYVAKHVGDQSRFIKLVRELYVESGRPSQLVLALAAVESPDQSDALLRDHLKAKPTDRLVYDHLAASLEKRDPAQLVSLVVQMIQAQPESARDYVAGVMKLKADPQALLADVDKLPADQRDSAGAWYLRGALYERADQSDQAAKAYDKAISIDKNFLTPQLATIDLQMRLGRYDEALKLLDKVAHPDDPDIRFTRARVLAEQGKTDDALKIVEDLLKQDPRNIKYRLFKANVQVAHRDYDEAERTLWSILDLDATNEPAYTALFDLYDNNPRTDNTQWIRLMKQVQREIPSSRIARLKMADWYAANRQFDRAEANLRALLAENPGDADALKSLVGILNETDHLDEAQKLLNDLAAKRPDDITPILLLEQIAAKQGKLEQFYPRKEAFLLKQKTSFQQQLMLAQLYDRWDKRDKAVTALEKAISLRPSAASDLRFSLAELYRSTKQYDKALAQIDLALKEAPGKAADLYYFKATIYQTMGKDALGEQTLEQALKADPNHAPSNNDLGYLWADQGRNLDQALSMVMKAVNAEPDNGAYLDSLGWVLYKMGRFDESRRRLEEARTKPSGSDPVILNHLGDALWRANQRSRAVEIWTEALNQARTIKDPDRTDITDAVKSLTAKLAAAAANKPPAVAPTAAEKPAPDTVPHP